MPAWPEARDWRIVRVGARPKGGPYGKSVESLCRHRRLCRTRGAAGHGRRVQPSGWRGKLEPRDQGSRVLVRAHPPDRPERRVRRHVGRCVSQHGRGQDLRAHGFPQGRHPDLVVPGGSFQPEAYLRRWVSHHHVPQRRLWGNVGQAGESRHAGPRRDALRLPRDADGAAPDQARDDLRRAGSERRDAQRRWRR